MTGPAPARPRVAIYSMFCLADQFDLAAEFREWRQPVGGHIDLMVFPGIANS